MEKSRVLLTVVSERAPTSRTSGDLFEILLDAGILVIDVQRRDHPVSQHPGAKAPRRSLRHPAVENELHHVGSANVKVLPNDLLKQNATVQWPVQNLREREFRLQDRQIVTVAGFSILRGERMWEP